jgi:uroporphyrin-III C-methyltransferase/precorrin-2 dehydrogenase/sirohydrochlorin ferrochelatase
LADVTVISPVPHDAELLTLRAVRALACADVLLVEADVGAGVLDFARREAERIFVHGLPAPEIAAHMRRFAAAGKRVVRLGTA